MRRRAHTTRMCTPNRLCQSGRKCRCSIAAGPPAAWAADPAGSGVTAGGVGPATPAERLEHAVMKIRSVAGGFAAAAIMTVSGFGYAAAQPGDLGTLPVDQNLITDSLGYNAAPHVLNPYGP